MKGKKCRNKAYSPLMRDVKCVDGEQEEAEMNECMQMRIWTEKMRKWALHSNWTRWCWTDSVIKAITHFQTSAHCYISPQMRCTQTRAHFVCMQAEECVWESATDEHGGRKSIPIRAPIKSDYEWLPSVGERWPASPWRRINNINKYILSHPQLNPAHHILFLSSLFL